MKCEVCNLLAATIRLGARKRSGATIEVSVCDRCRGSADARVTAWLTKGGGA